MILRPRTAGCDSSSPVDAHPNLSRILGALRHPRFVGLLLLVGALLGLAPGAQSQEPPQAKVQTVDFTTFTDLASSPLGEMEKMRAWKHEVPGIREVEIPSSSGGEAQPALFYDSGSTEPRPLLVALHSWTADYQKQFSIPYGAWAAKNDWVMIHPNYRGHFDRPEATLSEGAVDDILEALDWAMVNAAVDKNRVYVTGFSGGAMAALLMAGRYPELWTAVVAWVPVYDLVDWYDTVHEHTKLHYASDIVASCGGKPLPGTEAAAECKKRSPSTYLSKARGEDVDVLIAVGIEDWFVPPAHGMRAYNALAAKEDRLSDEEIAQVSDDETIPESLKSEAEHPLVAAAGRKILGERSSDQVELWIFDGSHDVIYNAGLSWLAQHRNE